VRHDRPAGRIPNHGGGGTLQEEVLITTVIAKDRYMAPAAIYPFVRLFLTDGESLSSPEFLLEEES
jgi:hypothetical protein